MPSRHVGPLPMPNWHLHGRRATSRARRRGTDRHRHLSPSPTSTAASWASASTPASSSSTPSRGTHACDYLFTVDMEMEPVPGYAFANWDKGYGDVHLVARSADAAARDAGSTGRRSSCATSHTPRPTSPVAVAPRTHPEARRSIARPRSATRHRRARSSSTTSSATRTATPRARPRTALSGRGLVPRGLPPAAGHAHEDVQRRSSAGTCAAPASRSSRTKGEWGTGSTRSTCATPTRSRWPTGTPSSSSASRRSRSARARRVTFMAKLDADAGRVELPPPPEPVARTATNAFAGEQRLGGVDVLGRVPLVPRRLDRARARARCRSTRRR